MQKKNLAKYWDTMAQSRLEVTLSFLARQSIDVVNNNFGF